MKPTHTKFRHHYVLHWSRTLSKPQTKNGVEYLTFSYMHKYIHIFSINMIL